MEANSAFSPSMNARRSSRLIRLSLRSADSLTFFFLGEAWADQIWPRRRMVLVLNFWTNRQRRIGQLSCSIFGQWVQGLSKPWFITHGAGCSSLTRMMRLLRLIVRPFVVWSFSADKGKSVVWKVQSLTKHVSNQKSIFEAPKICCGTKVDLMGFRVIVPSSWKVGEPFTAIWEELHSDVDRFMVLGTFRFARALRIRVIMHQWPQ